MVTMSTFINNRVKLLSNKGTLRELSEQSGINATKLWRMMNNLSPIDLDSVRKLERCGLIDYTEYLRTAWHTET